MPLRRAVSSLTAAHPRPCPYLYLCLLHAPLRWQPFHSTARLRDEQIDNSRNHYETLKLHPGATPAEIKKSFYALSKSHHPDHNPSHPHAARRFMRISEAYSILSIPAKRAAYDRDTLRLPAHSSSSPSHAHAHAHQHQGRPGSYSSTHNPAGGRAASGLSRRRGAFQGPPPSFFRSGGWGAQGAKRRAAHDDSTGAPGSQSSTSSTAGAGAGGMGPGQTPFRASSDMDSDTPHFDRAAHERTGRRIDHRRAQRAAASQMHGAEVSVEPERGMAGMFFVIGGVIALSVLVPLAVSKVWRGGGDGDNTQARKGGKRNLAAP